MIKRQQTHTQGSKREIQKQKQKQNKNNKKTTQTNKQTDKQTYNIKTRATTN